MTTGALPCGALSRPGSIPPREGERPPCQESPTLGLRACDCSSKAGESAQGPAQPRSSSPGLAHHLPCRLVCLSPSAAEEGGGLCPTHTLSPTPREGQAPWSLSWVRDPGTLPRRGGAGRVGEKGGRHLNRWSPSPYRSLPTTWQVE